jgi:hypothetical protein
MKSPTYVRNESRSHKQPLEKVFEGFLFYVNSSHFQFPNQETKKEEANKIRTQQVKFYFFLSVVSIQPFNSMFLNLYTILPFWFFIFLNSVRRKLNRNYIYVWSLIQLIVFLSSSFLLEFYEFLVWFVWTSCLYYCNVYDNWVMFTEM